MKEILLVTLLWTTSAAAQDKVAFFGLTMLDTSLQTAALGPDPAEAARLEALEKVVAERFQAEGYELV
ncbi:DUF2380 domain-containing protein, partial [Vibrio sp. 404]|nr:DUF2380 domain-containing protein [Vibrio marinisediminis]